VVVGLNLKVIRERWFLGQSVLSQSSPEQKKQEKAAHLEIRIPATEVPWAVFVGGLMCVLGKTDLEWGTDVRHGQGS
jgi:hypothetical protein